MPDESPAFKTSAPRMRGKTTLPRARRSRIRVGFPRGLGRSLARIWRQSPFVAIVAALALSMGIGFTTTMFSIVHGATRPLPFADADEIVAIEKVGTRASAADTSTRPFDYLAWAAGARSFEALGAFESIAMNLAEASADPERLTGAAITANAFSMLGRPPLLGRTLHADDMRAGAVPVVLLSHALWQRRFGGDRAIVGRALRLSGITHTVVGVMPERFGFPVNAAFWIPLPIDGVAWQPRTGPALRAFGRLADGVTMAGAQAELDTITARLAASGPDSATAAGLRIDVMPFQDIETPREVIRGLYLLVVAVSFVLLIACANVANLLVARAAVRARDAALRLALGATQKQLVMEQLADTLSLSAVAMLVGLAFAHAGTRVFAANTSHIIEAFWVDFRVDGMVLVFASLLAGVATLAAGLGPALRIARSNVADVLKDRAFGASGLAIGRMSRAMIAVQVALACGLLALTLVLARSAVQIRSVAWPFDPSSLLTFEFQLPDSSLEHPADRHRRLTALTSALNATAGVDAAALTSALPGRGGGAWTFSLDAPANAGDRLPTTAVSLVSPEFFALTNSRLHSGRLLTWQDDESAPRVVVINDSFARRFSADRDPLGRRVFLGNREFAIVGVVSDAMARDVQERADDGFYVSILQLRPYAIRVMARGLADPAAMMPAIRDTLRTLEPDMPLAEVFTLHEAVYRDKRVLDVLSALFLVFGIGALSLTAVGLYGVVSFAITQRTREIGIRLALGARRSHLLALVAGQGARQLAIGLGAGVLLAMALSRGFSAAVEQLPIADAPLLAGICLALAATVLIALAVPARRALRLEIVQALRRE